MIVRCATFNVLADAYVRHGSYGHVDQNLLRPGARTKRLVELIDALPADVIALQEVEPDLVAALYELGKWQLSWAPKVGGAPDGCVTLVAQNVVVERYEWHAYSDGSGHVMQSLFIGGVEFVNTHIEWDAEDSPNHAGARQTQELLGRVSDRAVVMSDCNGRPNGLVRGLFTDAGFANADGDWPTAFVNGGLAALDVIATRGVRAQYEPSGINPEGIPSVECPSDHIPVLATLGI